MAEDPLRTAIDGIKSRLHDELEAQLARLSSHQQEEIEAARRTAEAEAEQRWSAKAESVRAEWTARLESEIGAARAEAERRMVAESMRLRVEAEQMAAESAARVREELEQALAEERERGSTELAAERERGSSQLAAERQQLSSERDELRLELDAARQQFDSVVRERDEIVAARDLLVTELERERRAREEDTTRQQQAAAELADARVSERQTQLAIVERLLSAIRSMDAARSLSDVLSALTTSAAAEAPRVALFVVEGAELRGWISVGFSGAPSALQANVKEAGLFHEVMRRREPVVTAADAGPAAPAFSSLPRDRAAIAVPLLVGAQPVAVLYADDASEGPPSAPASWPEAIQILGRHASLNLAHLTAARAAQMMRQSLAPGAGAPANSASAAAPEDGNSARRYAKLLVSEIKLYNETAVRMGRQQRDLLARLKPEIERARRLYEQRISSAVDSRGAFFHQELVQTLADGDPALLGGSA